MILDPAMLAALPPDAVLQVSIRVGDLRQAYEQRQGGPAVLSTRAAAARFGWKPADWARWATGGLIPGAVKIGKGWNLPRDACEALHNSRMKKPRAGAAPAPAQTKTTTTPRLSDRRGNHGPRSRRENEEAEETGTRPGVLSLTERLAGV